MGDIELQVFADRLKELRSKKNITQKDFAEKIGVTAAALSAYENNVKNPSIAVAKRIAEVFHVSIDWLCGLTDKESYDEQFETFSDIIQILFRIDSESPFTFSLEVDPYSRKASIVFDSPKIVQFIKEWEKIRQVYGQKLIDNDVYALWQEKELMKYHEKLKFPTN